MMRRSRQDEVGLILDWAAAEGWNPGLDDATALFAATPQGFFIAEHCGAPVAAISVGTTARRSPSLASTCACQNSACAASATRSGNMRSTTRAPRRVGLDGVAAQQANYAKSGFVPAGASLRFQRPLAARPVRGIRLAKPADLAGILALDRAATGVERPGFLKAWTAPTRTRHTLVLDGATGLAGFATIRHCREGVKIGPIAAPDAVTRLKLARARLDVARSDLAIIAIVHLPCVPPPNPPAQQARHRWIWLGWRGRFPPPHTLGLGMATGPSEAETFWTDFPRDLVRRGLGSVKLVISDAHKGIKAATARVLSTTWQRCGVHFQRIALAHTGKSSRRVVPAFIAATRPRRIMRRRRPSGASSPARSGASCRSSQASWMVQRRTC